MPSSQDTSRADRALSHREMYGHDGTSRCRAAWHRAHLSQELRGAGHRVPMPHDPSRWGSHAMAAVAAPPMMRLTPRPYQYEAVAALLAAAARGVQRSLLVLPTGTGKTIVFALLVQRRGGRSLILAHRDELIVQAAHDEHTAPTGVASVQTLSRRTRLTRVVPDFHTIVIDEAHHAPAPTYRRILEYCRAWRPDGPLVVGVTATPARGDRQSLRPV